MPLLRRPPRPADTTAAAARVDALLPARPAVTGGWVLPEETSAPLTGPVAEPDEEAASGSWTPSSGPTGRHVATRGLLDRLREARYDPGRRATAGLAAVALLACLGAGALVLRGRPRPVVVPEVTAVGSQVVGTSLASAAPTGEVVVSVAGTVRRPGLVRLPAGSRVDDAVRAAGGLQPGAAVGMLNLARRLQDGEQVLVGVAPAARTAPAAASGTGGAGALVDLNTAGVAELDALPGLGPVLAQRIVDHRTKEGPFRSVDQLREVSGIGEAKFSSLRDLVTV